MISDMVFLLTHTSGGLLCASPQKVLSSELQLDKDCFVMQLALYMP